MKKGPTPVAAQVTAPVTNQAKIIDFATLASWYAEQNTAKDTKNDWSTPRLYAEKQRNLRFLTL